LELRHLLALPLSNYTEKKIMEKIVPFKKTDYTRLGTHIVSGKFISEMQRDWEADFHNQFKPYFANVLEGHPAAMQRLTRYWEGDEPEYDFGMEKIDGEIDIDTNLEIEKFSNTKTVYAIGSQLHDDEDNPLLLVKNENLSEEILMLKYVSDDDETAEDEGIPVNETSFSKH
jgi:hypothetical protein